MKSNKRLQHQVLLVPVQLLFWLALSAGPVQGQVLPDPPGDPKASSAALARLHVHGFLFDGNRAFSDAELAKVVEPFTGRELGSDDIEEARRSVTLHYIRHGYVNSGAVVPDQNPADGIILIRVTEGELTEINLHGNKWLRDGYIRSRLQRWSGPPLRLTDLQEGLQLLRLNPNVRQINAELKPGTSVGQSVLDVRVEDQQPFRLGLQFDNQRPPSVGSEEISLLGSDLNLTGNSDPLRFRYGIANADGDGLELSGANNLEGSYELPFTRFDTSIGLHGSRLNTSIVEASLLPLDISSLTKSFGVVLRQPLYQSSRDEIAVSLGFDHSENTSWLLGERFNISPGAVDGRMVVSVLRFSQDWLRRGPNHVVALRSTFNFGLDAFDASDSGVPGDPNAQFFSWQGQGQYIQRLFATQNQIILRLSGQWSSERLLALEQISVGGYNTVRGYLENQLVRDRGLIASVEGRVPVLFDKSGAGMLHLAPFFDFGGGWNNDDSPHPATISSVGMGLLLNVTKHFSAEVYYGYRLRDVTIPDGSGLQGHGVGVKVNLVAF